MQIALIAASYSTRHIAREIARYLIQVQSTERSSLELESYVNYGKLYAIAYLSKRSTALTKEYIDAAMRAQW